MISPAANFLCCCGYDLGTGVKWVGWTHLVASIYTLACAIANLTLQMPTYGYASSSSQQLVTAVWAMTGIPIILVGLWGVYHGLEPHVRIYFYFFGVTVIFDTVYMLVWLLDTDSCMYLKLEIWLNSGKALACGVARSSTMAVFLTVTFMAIYAAYILWSWCEDMVTGGTASVIASLLESMDDRKSRFKSFPYFNSHVGPAYAGYDDANLERSVMRNGGMQGGRIANYMA